MNVEAVAPHVPCASARVPVQLAVGKVMDVVQEAEQRAEHEPDRSDVTELNPALGRLVNNTGDDGGAASG